MNTYFHRTKLRLFYKFTSIFVAITFVFSSIVPPSYAQFIPQSALSLPAAGAMVPVSASFTPTLIKGITIHPENPLEFDFIVNEGDNSLSDRALREEAYKMIKYFLASLTVPEEEQWVNLSPYEKDRIIPQRLGETEMGRDLLAQDYLLKQLTASMIYPEDELGQKFWDRVYAKAQKQFGTRDIPMNTFNKVWIVPEKAVIYEHENTAFVVSSHLKVMMQEDYVALEANKNNPAFGLNTSSSTLGQEKIISNVSSEIIREILIPEIEKEINGGENFANLRQVYNSMILATWYKMNLKESLLGQVYVDQNKTVGIDLENKNVKQEIYDRYIEAFSKGVYNYIKEEYDPVTQNTVPRKHFSGGMVGVSSSIITAVSSFDQLSRADQAIFSSPVKGENSRFTVRVDDIGPGADTPKAIKIAQAHSLAVPPVEDVWTTKGAIFDRKKDVHYRLFGDINGQKIVPILAVLTQAGVFDDNFGNFNDTNFVSIKQIARKFKRSADVGETDYEENLGNIYGVFETLALQNIVHLKTRNEDSEVALTPLGVALVNFVKSGYYTDFYDTTAYSFKYHNYVHRQQSQVRPYFLREESDAQKQLEEVLLGKIKQYTAFIRKLKERNLIDRADLLNVISNDLDEDGMQLNADDRKRLVDIIKTFPQEMGIHIIQRALVHLHTYAIGIIMSPIMVGLGMPEFKYEDRLIDLAGPSIFDLFKDDQLDLNTINNIAYNRSFIKIAFEVLASQMIVEIDGDVVRLTPYGKVFIKRAGSYGVTDSYTLIDLSLDELLFGNPDPLDISHEGHMGEDGRTKDTWGSREAHGAYMGSYTVKDDQVTFTREGILSMVFDLYNETPLEVQPLGFINLGSGDAGLQLEILEFILEHTNRGKNLSEYPFVAVISDFNEAAIKRQKSTLQDLEKISGLHIIYMQADITEPEDINERLKPKLSEIGFGGRDISDFERTEEFITHERSLKVKDPKRAKEIIAKTVKDLIGQEKGREKLIEAMALFGYTENSIPNDEGELIDFVISQFQGSFVNDNPRGRLVPGYVQAADEIDYWRRWVKILQSRDGSQKAFGMRTLELHMPRANDQYQEVPEDIHVSMRVQESLSGAYRGTHWPGQYPEPFAEKNLITILAGIYAVSTVLSPGKEGSPVAVSLNQYEIPQQFNSDISVEENIGEDEKEFFSSPVVIDSEKHEAIIMELAINLGSEIAEARVEGDESKVTELIERGVKEAFKDSQVPQSFVKGLVQSLMNKNKKHESAISRIKGTLRSQDGAAAMISSPVESIEDSEGLEESLFLMMKSIGNRVKIIVTDVLGGNPDTISLTKSFKDLGASDSDVTKIMKKFQDEFDIRISDDDLKGISSIGSSISYILVESIASGFSFSSPVIIDSEKHEAIIMELAINLGSEIAEARVEGDEAKVTELIERGVKKAFKDSQVPQGFVKGLVRSLMNKNKKHESAISRIKGTLRSQDGAAAIFSSPVKSKWEEVKDMIIDLFAVDPAAEVTLDANFYTDLEVDSLDVDEFILEFENKFKIKILNDDSKRKIISWRSAMKYLIDNEIISPISAVEVKSYLTETKFVARRNYGFGRGTESMFTPNSDPVELEVTIIDKDKLLVRDSGKKVASEKVDTGSATSMLNGFIKAVESTQTSDSEPHNVYFLSDKELGNINLKIAESAISSPVSAEDAESYLTETKFKARHTYDFKHGADSELEPNSDSVKLEVIVGKNQILVSDSETGEEVGKARVNTKDPISMLEGFIEAVQLTETFQPGNYYTLTDEELATINEKTTETAISSPVKSIEDRVVSVVVNALPKVKPSEVTLEASFKNNLRADSLDKVVIVEKLEEEFNISIEDKDSREIDTVKSALEYLMKERVVVNTKIKFYSSILNEPGILKKFTALKKGALSLAGNSTTVKPMTSSEEELLIIETEIRLYSSYRNRNGIAEKIEGLKKRKQELEENKELGSIISSPVVFHLNPSEEITATLSPTSEVLIIVYDEENPFVDPLDGVKLMSMPLDGNDSMESTYYLIPRKTYGNDASFEDGGVKLQFNKSYFFDALGNLRFFKMGSPDKYEPAVLEIKSATQKHPSDGTFEVRIKNHSEKDITIKRSVSLREGVMRATADALNINRRSVTLETSFPKEIWTRSSKIKYIIDIFKQRFDSTYIFDSHWEDIIFGKKVKSIFNSLLEKGFGRGESPIVNDKVIKKTGVTQSGVPTSSPVSLSADDRENLITMLVFTLGLGIEQARLDKNKDELTRLINKGVEKILRDPQVRLDFVEGLATSFIEKPKESSIDLVKSALRKPEFSFSSPVGSIEDRIDKIKKRLREDKRLKNIIDKKSYVGNFGVSTFDRDLFFEAVQEEFNIVISREDLYMFVKGTKEDIIPYLRKRGIKETQSYASSPIVFRVGPRANSAVRKALPFLDSNAPNGVINDHLHESVYEGRVANDIVRNVQKALEKEFGILISIRQYSERFRSLKSITAHVKEELRKAKARHKIKTVHSIEELGLHIGKMFFTDIDELIAEDFDRNGLINMIRSQITVNIEELAEEGKSLDYQDFTVKHESSEPFVGSHRVGWYIRLIRVDDVIEVFRWAPGLVFRGKKTSLKGEMYYKVRLSKKLLEDLSFSVSVPAVTDKKNISSPVSAEDTKSYLTETEFKARHFLSFRHTPEDSTLGAIIDNDQISVINKKTEEVIGKAEVDTKSSVSMLKGFKKAIESTRVAEFGDYYMLSVKEIATINKKIVEATFSSPVVDTVDRLGLHVVEVFTEHLEKKISASFGRKIPKAQITRFIKEKINQLSSKKEQINLEITVEDEDSSYESDFSQIRSKSFSTKWKITLIKAKNGRHLVMRINRKNQILNSFLEGKRKEYEVEIGGALKKLLVGASISSPLVITEDLQPGGIDLNAELLDLQIKRDGNGIPLPVFNQPMEQLMNIQGFVPVIINVTPVNVPMLLGLATTSDSDSDFSLTPDMDPGDRKARFEYEAFEEVSMVN